MKLDRMRIPGVVLLLLAVFVTGIWLSQSGRPLDAMMMAVHQLIALGTAAYLAAVVYRAGQATRLKRPTLTAAVVTGLLFLVTGVSGGMLSSNQDPSASLHGLHQITPVLTTLSAAVTLALLRGRGRTQE